MAGIKQQASPVLLGRTTEAEVVDPVQPELYGTLTNRFGGNACLLHRAGAVTTADNSGGTRCS
jgi:hypothetical protein